MTSRDEQLDAVAALGDPVRRALYDYVAAGSGGVSTDAAAHALAMPRSTTAFHLDRLTEAGLLSVITARPSGRTGPGSGRPAKLYSRVDAELVVSLPARRYDLMGDLLASALDSAHPHETASTALRRVATARGQADGRRAASLPAVLAELGYEPTADAHGTALVNCPFHALAADHTEVVCAANLAYLSGVAEATGVDPDRVSLAPSAGRCCVRVD